MDKPQVGDCVLIEKYHPRWNGLTGRLTRIVLLPRGESVVVELLEGYMVSCPLRNVVVMPDSYCKDDKQAQKPTFDTHVT